MSLNGTIKRIPGAEVLWRRLRPLPDVSPKPSPTATDYPRPIAGKAEANGLIRSLLESARPVLCSRVGANELNCVTHYLDWRCGRDIPEPYPETTRYRMPNNAGFFPPTDECLDAFAREYLAAFRPTDVLGVWLIACEDRFVR